MKDLCTHQILLQGHEYDGLYQLQLLHSSSLGLVVDHMTGTDSCIDSGLTQLGLWHRRLGHPSIDVLVLSSSSALQPSQTIV